MSQKAYYSSVTESERGWGVRPDGYLIALSKDDFSKGKEYITEDNTSEYISLIDNHKPLLCFITDKMANNIKNSKNNFIWTDDKKETWLLED
tara:strand:+ start:193 stop:468 length:276 start_codon:yes stop_codon:yes gene_type:complete